MMSSAAARTRQIKKRGPKRWFPKQWRDRVELYDHLEDFELQKQEAYEAMDRDGFGAWTVFTAGAGFFTGAYDIFAVNTVVPLVNISYYGGNMQTHTQVAISMASLIGTLCGQVVLGILADRYGRKKMFFRLLVGLIIGTVCLSLVSRGAQNSLDVLALIIFWRIWIGFFLGGDYPLSAAITAEFAPKEHRGRMLSTVFFGQPLGQLVACLVSLITTSALRQGISGASLHHCTGQCLHTADMAWRWIVGFGAIPPVIALVLRWYIPESPRWLLEVERNPLGLDAAEYPKGKFYGDPLDGDDIETGQTAGNQEQMAEHLQVLSDQQLAPSQAGSSAGQPWGDDIGTDYDRSPKTTPLELTDPDYISPVPLGGQDVETPGGSALEPSNPQAAPLQNSDQQSQAPRPQAPLPQLQSWKEFWDDFGEYLFGPEPAPWTWKRLWDCMRFQDEHFFDGSWTDLAGLASSWFLLDFGFYFLIVNSFKLMSKIWAKEDPDDVYTVISQYPWRIIASTSVGAVVGGAAFIAMARNRWKLQLFGFLGLVVLFVVVGIVFIKLIGGRYFAIFIVLYCLCHLAFNLGPNTSTFVIAAEVFPTQFRASCHGISAAAGKFGSILTQVFLSEAKINGKGVDDERSDWLGWALIIQAFVMLLGAVITWRCVPNPCDINGNPRTLEELGRGKQARRQMEEEERATRERNRVRTRGNGSL